MLSRRPHPWSLPVALLVLAAIAAACMWQPRAAAAEASLTGSWKVSVTSFTDAPIPQLVTFTGDGTTITSANQRPGADGQINYTTAGQGQWVQTGALRYTNTFLQLIFSQTGDSVGTIQVTDDISLAPDGMSWSGRFNAQVFDPDGNIEIAGDGDEQASRIGAGGATLPALDWTGSWSTNFGGMRLSQSGSSVSGVYEYKQGILVGVVDGNVLRGTFTESPYTLEHTGDFELTLSPDGRSFNGRWRYSTFRAGEWSTQPWTGVR